MQEYKTNSGAVPTQTSPVFETIARMNRKVDSLRDKLAPVIQEVPSNLLKENSGGTELLNQLTNLEDKITTILDSVVI